MICQVHGNEIQQTSNVAYIRQFMDQIVLHVSTSDLNKQENLILVLKPDMNYT